MDRRKLGAALGCLICTLLFTFSEARAADSSTAASRSTYALVSGTNEFGVWGGGSPDSIDFIGRVPDTSLLLVGLRYGRVLASWDSFSLQYTFDILPVAAVFPPDRLGGRHSTIYGAGVSPVGFKINFGQESWIKPFLAASVGFLYFEDDVPVPDSSRFNFTPELGGGLQFFLTPRRAITLGYKYHHISNADRSRRNPGLDSNVIYAGFSIFTP
jgi:opacity protein-like surface antigen